MKRVNYSSVSSGEKDVIQRQHDETFWFYSTLVLLLVMLTVGLIFANYNFQQNKIYYQEDLNVSYELGYINGSESMFFAIQQQLYDLAINCDQIKIENEFGNQLNLIAIICLQNGD